MMFMTVMYIKLGVKLSDWELCWYVQYIDIEQRQL